MKEKQYTEIEFDWGSNLEDCVKKLLQSSNKLIKGTFNGTTLYSDTVTMDSAYLEIVGMTLADMKESQRKMREEHKKAKKDHKSNIPKLTEEFKVKGREILEEQYLELWDGIVPVRLSDLYQGMELGACLDIIKEFPDLDKAKEIFVEQGHSGMSGSLVLNMVAQLCTIGKDFV